MVKRCVTLLTMAAGILLLLLPTITEAAPTRFTGRFQGIDSEGRAIFKGGDVGYKRFELEPSSVKAFRKQLEEGGKYQLLLDEEDRIIRVRTFQQMLQAMRPGDEVIINDVQGVVVKVEGNRVTLAGPGGGRFQPVLKHINEMTNLTEEAREEGDPERTSLRFQEVLETIEPGQMWQIGGIEGQVYENLPFEGKITLIDADEEKHVFYYGRIRIHPEPLETETPEGGNGGEEQPSVVFEEIAHRSGYQSLDFVGNQRLVPGKVLHGTSGFLAVGVRVVCKIRTHSGLFDTPEKEAELLEWLQNVPEGERLERLEELGRFVKGELGTERVITGRIRPGAVEYATVELSPMLPRIWKDYTLELRYREPSFRINVEFDRGENLLGFVSPKAVPYLLQLYENHQPLERGALANAMVRNDETSEVPKPKFPALIMSLLAQTEDEEERGAVETALARYTTRYLGPIFYHVLAKPTGPIELPGATREDGRPFTVKGPAALAMRKLAIRLLSRLDLNRLKAAHWVIPLLAVPGDSEEAVELRKAAREFCRAHPFASFKAIARYSQVNPYREVAMELLGQLMREHANEFFAMLDEVGLSNRPWSTVLEEEERRRMLLEELQETPFLAQEGLDYLGEVVAAEKNRLESELEDYRSQLREQARSAIQAWTAYKAAKEEAREPATRGRIFEQLATTLTALPQHQKLGQAYGDLALTIARELASGLQLRSGPGEGFGSLGQAKVGQRYPLKGEAPDWLQVELEDGRIGFLPRRHCAIEEQEVVVEEAPTRNEIVGWYLRAIRNNPDLKEPAFTGLSQQFLPGAQAAANLGNAEKAWQLVEALLRYDPTPQVRKQAHSLMARLYLKNAQTSATQGNDDAAAQEYGRALAFNPRSLSTEDKVLATFKSNLIVGLALAIMLLGFVGSFGYFAYLRLTAGIEVESMEDIAIKDKDLDKLL